MAALQGKIIFATSVLVIYSVLCDATKSHEQVVITDPEVTLQKGKQGLLPCKVETETYVVRWIKGLTLGTAKPIVGIDRYYNFGERSGPGYDDGLYTINDELSLVIYDVRLEDEGQYFCEVVDVKTDMGFSNSTTVTVFALPAEPFPTIEECQNSSNGQDGQECKLFSSAPLSITCSVHGYLPSIGLYIYHKSKKLKTAKSREWTGDDGTKSKSVIIEAVASIHWYTCVASGIPGSDEYGDRYANVLVSSGETTYQTVTGTSVSSQATEVAHENNNNTHTLMYVIEIILGIFCASFFVYRVMRRYTSSGGGRYQRVGTGTTVEDVFDLSNDAVSAAQEVQDFVRKLAGRHCRRLTDAIYSKRMDLPRSIESIIDENNDVLFDANRMMTDWLKGQNSSRDEIRRQIRDAAISDRGKDLNDDDWICDHELRQTVKYLRPGIVQELLLQLHTTNNENGSNTFQVLRTWRDYGESSSNREKRQQLISALLGTRFDITVLIESELELVCNNFKNSDKFDNLRKGLDLKIAHEPNSPGTNRSTHMKELQNWRNVPYSSIPQWMLRNTLNTVLKRLGSPGLLAYRKGNCVYKCELVTLAMDMYIQDIRPFTEALGIEENKLDDYKRDFEHGNADKGTYFLLALLLDTFRYPFRDERGELSDALLRKVGYIECCRKYHLGTYQPNGICKAIENLDEGKLRELVKLLMSKGVITDEENRCRSTEEPRQFITDWFARWIKDLEGYYSESEPKTTRIHPTIHTKDKAHLHRNFNDELLESGFFNLAHEVMIIEHQVTADLPADQ